MPNPTSTKPLVGITTDIRTIESLERRVGSTTYANAITRAGGIPLFLDTNPDLIPDYLNTCHAFVLTGGDDPVMEHFGIPTHPEARKVHEDRQRFELALLKALAPATPTLGVCLGMQYMALHANGTIDQHLPDTTQNAKRHWNHDHPVIAVGESGLSGVVQSKHRQAISDPGSLIIAATSDDGLIEAISDPARPFYLGVQWHPERTDDPNVGITLFEQLVAAARNQAANPKPAP